MLVLVILPKWTEIKLQAQQIHQEQPLNSHTPQRASAHSLFPLDTESSWLTMAVIGHKTVCDHQ